MKELSAELYFIKRELERAETDELQIGNRRQAAMCFKCLVRGFTNATDQQRANAFLRRSIRCGLCPPDLLPCEEQYQAANEQLFDKILANNNHLLHNLLPPPTVASQNYDLRPRVHNRQLFYILDIKLTAIF